jgi:5-dehydro-2-deoxygluconokinase
MNTKPLDLITMGRSSMDLYSNNMGARFEDITSFAAYVGGSPTNIAVGVRRLGLEVGLLTALGEDRSGDFILNFLNLEGIETGMIPHKPGHPTSAVLLGIEANHKTPLVFYRDNCADIELSIDDVIAANLERAGALEISGTGLAKDPSRSATFYAVERAKALGKTVFMDIDFRANQWHDPRAFGVAVRAILPMVDVAIGTEEEINAVGLTSKDQLKIVNSQIQAPEIEGDLNANIKLILERGPKALVVKTGAKGAEVHLQSGEVITAPGFQVEVYNTVGAGDAFGSGFIYGQLQGWDWYKSVRLGNACGAIVVSRHACANAMPTMTEILELVNAQGGW